MIRITVDRWRADLSCPCKIYKYVCMRVCCVWICQSQREGIDFHAGAGRLKVLIFTLRLNPQKLTGAFYLFMPQPSQLAQLLSHSSLLHTNLDFSLLWQRTHKYTHTYLDPFTNAHPLLFASTCINAFENGGVLDLSLECIIPQGVCLPSKYWYYPPDTPALFYCTFKHSPVSTWSAQSKAKLPHKHLDNINSCL